MPIVLIVVVVVLNVPVVLALGWCFFGDWHGLVHCLVEVTGHLLAWNPLSEASREPHGFFELMRLAGYFLTCAAVFYAEYLALSWLGWV